MIYYEVSVECEECNIKFKIIRENDHLGLSREEIPGICPFCGDKELAMHDMTTKTGKTKKKEKKK